MEEEDPEEADCAGDKNLCGMRFGEMTIEGLSQMAGAVHYYTSLTDMDHFNYVFSSLGPAAMDLKYQCKKLKPQDEFLLTLMKLRLNKDDLELSLFFGIHQATVGRIFHTWINFMYYQWKELKIWSSRQLIDDFMPSDFQAKYPSTRVIIDGTEIPIQKPSSPEDQSATWSSYKNRNTLKVMVGISPRGDVTHVSEVYGGAASDRQIVERSDLLQECSSRFDRGDSIMADRGFIVQDLFLMDQVRINIPTVMRGMTQLPPQKVIEDRKIASKRVHVERVIGLAKHFKILKDEMHHKYLTIGGRILFVCFAICNFKPSMVSKDA